MVIVPTKKGGYTVQAATETQPIVPRPTCATGWDASKDCLECLPYYSPVGFCNVLAANYDATTGLCLLTVNGVAAYFDYSKKCASCLFGFSGTSCTVADPYAVVTITGGSDSPYVTKGGCIGLRTVGSDGLCSACSAPFTTDCSACDSKYLCDFTNYKVLGCSDAWTGSLCNVAVTTVVPVSQCAACGLRHQCVQVNSTFYECRCSDGFTDGGINTQPCNGYDQCTNDTASAACGTIDQRLHSIPVSCVSTFSDSTSNFVCELNSAFKCTTMRANSVPYLDGGATGLAQYTCACKGYYMNNASNPTGDCIPGSQCVAGNPVQPGSCKFKTTAATCPAGTITKTCYPGLIPYTADMCTFDSNVGGALCSCPNGYGRFASGSNVYDPTLQSYYALYPSMATKCVPLGNNCSVPVQFVSGGTYSWSFYLVKRDGAVYGSLSGGISDTTTVWKPAAEYDPLKNQCTITATTQAELDSRAETAVVQNATCGSSCISDYYMCEQDYMGMAQCKCKFGFKYEPLAHLVSQSDSRWDAIECPDGMYKYIVPGTTDAVGCEPMPCFFPKSVSAFDPDVAEVVPEVVFVQATKACDHLLCETSKIATKKADGSCQCEDAVVGWSFSYGSTPCNSLEQPQNAHCAFTSLMSGQVPVPVSVSNHATVDFAIMPPNGPCAHLDWDFTHARSGFSAAYKMECEAWNLAHSSRVMGVYAVDQTSASRVTDGEPSTTFTVNASVPVNYQFWGIGFPSKQYISEIMVGAVNTLNFRVHTSNRLGYLFDASSAYTGVVAVNSLTSANSIIVGSSSLGTLFQTSPGQIAKAIVFRSSMPAVPLAISNLTVVHSSAYSEERHEGFVYGSASGRPVEQADPSATYNSGANLQLKPFVMWFVDELVKISKLSFVLERELQSGEAIEVWFLSDVKPGRPQDATYVGTTTAATTSSGQHLSVLTKHMEGSHVWIEPVQQGAEVGVHDVYLAPQQYVYEHMNK